MAPPPPTYTPPASPPLQGKAPASALRLPLHAGGNSSPSKALPCVGWDGRGAIGVREKIIRLQPFPVLRVRVQIRHGIVLLPLGRQWAFACGIDWREQLPDRFRCWPGTVSSSRHLWLLNSGLRRIAPRSGSGHP